MKTSETIQEKIAVQAKKEISAAWQRVDKLGLAFGKICYEWQQKFVNVVSGKSSTQGKRGCGLRPILDDLNIHPSTAYACIARYKESEGIVDVELPPNADEQKHERISAEMRQCLENKSFPVLGVAWAPWKASTDADVEIHGKEPNNDRYRVTLFLSQKQAKDLICPR